MDATNEKISKLLKKKEQLTGFLRDVENELRAVQAQEYNDKYKGHYIIVQRQGEIYYGFVTEVMKLNPNYCSFYVSFGVIERHTLIGKSAYSFVDDSCFSLSSTDNIKIVSKEAFKEAIESFKRNLSESIDKYLDSDGE